MAWLHAQKPRVTYAEFGRRPRVNRSEATIHRLATGKRLPDKETMRAIYIETAGVVDANSFYGIGPELLAGAREAAE